LVLIPPENDPKHPTIEGIPSAAILRKPFYLPDLLELMDQLCQDDPPAKPANSNLLGWINQPILDQLLATTSASAGAVARRKGGLVLGGTLPEGAENGLAALMSRFWQREERTDLVRFARLESTQGSLDCLIYLTALHMEDETAAGLVYPIQTPLSKVRVQAAPLIHALHELSGQSAAQAEDRPSLQPAVSAPVEEKQYSAEWADPVNDQADYETEFPTFNLAELLGSIPSPDPNGKTTQPANSYNEWQPEMIYQFSGGLTGETSALPAEPPPNGSIRAETEAEQLPPPQPVSTGPVNAAAENSVTTVPPLPPQDAFAAQLNPEHQDLTAGEVSPTTAADALTIAANYYLDDSEADAAGEQGSVLTSLTSLNQLEPAAAGLSQLNYTCVLIPRLPQHYLTRELSEKIGQWIQQVCLAFGWRLEGIALRPEYMQWTVQVTPTISPGNIVKIVRQRTSELIFEQFETLRKQNPSGDFWATGYLIVSGSQPPSAGLLRDYIQQTRRRQGIIKNPAETPPRLNS
jgi:putative transposase